MRHISKITLLVLLFCSCSLMSYGQRKKKKNKKSHTTENSISKDKIDDHKAEFVFSEGMKYYILSDYNYALQIFQSALQFSSNRSAIYFQISKCYDHLSKLDDAIINANLAVNQDKSNIFFQEHLFNLYLKNGSVDKAAKVAEDLITKSPKNVEYSYSLAQVYAEKGEVKKAIEYINKVEAVVGADPQLTNQKQSIYLKANDIKSAIKEGEKLAAAFPEHFDYQIDLSRYYIVNKQYTEAQKILDQALKNDPTDINAILIRSEFFRIKGDNEKANLDLLSAIESPKLDFETKLQEILKQFGSSYSGESLPVLLKLSEKLTEFHPTEERAHSFRADVLYAQNDKKGSRDSYLKAAELNNSNYKVWYQVVVLDAELNDNESLLKHTDLAIESFPNQSFFWFYNGMANFLLKKYSDAIISLEQSKLLTTEQTILGQINALLGDAYHSEKKYEKSYAAYDAVLQLDSNNEHVLNNYSYYLSLRKVKLEKAKEMGARLIKLNPNNSTYLDTYGWVLYSAGDFKEAKIHLEKASQNSASSVIIEHFGDALFQLNEVESAVEQWKKAILLNPEDPEKLQKKISQRKLIE